MLPKTFERLFLVHTIALELRKASIYYFLDNKPTFNIQSCLVQQSIHLIKLSCSIVQQSNLSFRYTIVIGKLHQKVVMQVLVPSSTFENLVLPIVVVRCKLKG